MKNKLHHLAVAIAAAGVAAMVNVAFADTLSRDIKHSTDTNYKFVVEQAEADYKSAKVKCDGLKGHDKDVCMQQAKATYEETKADAKAARKSDDAYAEAGEDKREANYKVAKEQCKSLSGDAKDACVQQAKAKYGQ